LHGAVAVEGNIDLSGIAGIVDSKIDMFTTIGRALTAPFCTRKVVAVLVVATDNACIGLD